MRRFSNQPEMIKWALVSLIFDSIWQLKNKLLSMKYVLHHYFIDNICDAKQLGSVRQWI